MGWVTGLALAAAALSAGGAIVQGQQAKRQGEFQASVAEQQAARERAVAAANEQDFRRQQSRDMSRRIAAMGATGVDPAQGSPLFVSEDFAGETEVQALRIREGGEVRSNRLRQQAELSRMAGSSAETQSFFRAGSLLLTGAGRALDD